MGHVSLCQENICAEKSLMRFCSDNDEMLFHTAHRW